MFPPEPSALADSRLVKEFGGRIMKLTSGQILISGWTELNLLDYPKPVTPELWFGIPVYRSGKLKGALLLRFEARNILGLLNRDTQMLYGRNGRRVGNGKLGIAPPPRTGNPSLARKFPGEWRQVASFASGQFRNQAGLFAFTTIHPDQVLNLDTGVANFPEPVWKLVSHYPRFNASRKALIFQESNWLDPGGGCHRAAPDPAVRLDKSEPEALRGHPEVARPADHHRLENIGESARFLGNPRNRGEFAGTHRQDPAG